MRSMAWGPREALWIVAIVSIASGSPAKSKVLFVTRGNGFFTIGDSVFYNFDGAQRRYQRIGDIVFLRSRRFQSLPHVGLPLVHRQRSILSNGGTRCVSHPKVHKR